LTNEQNTAPKVSVLMTCYNAASTIEESVRSVIAQTFTDWELVLVDNCSTDGSMDIVRSIADPRVKITQLDRNHGRTPALNIGLGKARGEYLAILDADDISAPHRFALQVECLQANSGVVAVASWYQNIDSKGKMVNEVVIPTTNLELVRKLASNCPFMNSAMMFKTEPTREVGGYDESFQYSQDLALWLGLASLGEFRSIPEFLTSIRLSPTSLTNVAHFGMARTHDAYVLYRRAQKLDGLRPVDRLRGMRTIGLYGLLYSWRSLREGSVVRAAGLLIANFWAIPLALFELLRNPRGLGPRKSI
jgi:hypothetical protein